MQASKFKAEESSEGSASEVESSRFVGWGLAKPCFQVARLAGMESHQFSVGGAAPQALPVDQALQGWRMMRRTALASKTYAPVSFYQWKLSMYFKGKTKNKKNYAPGLKLSSRRGTKFY